MDDDLPTPSSTPVENEPLNKNFGLTFASLDEPTLPPGATHMSCHGAPQDVDQPHAGSCNPYVGDTRCTSALPVLCIRKDGSSPPQSSYEFDFYGGWVGGTLASTAPIAGTALLSRSDADSLCTAELGEGFAMAEFHDAGGGWGLVGITSADLDTSLRHWVFIDDQPANCWDRADARETTPPATPR